MLAMSATVAVPGFPKVSSNLGHDEGKCGVGLVWTRKVRRALRSGVGEITNEGGTWKEGEFHG